MPRLFDQTPPSYLKWARLFLSKSDNTNQIPPFPYIASVTDRIVLCTKVKTSIFSIKFIHISNLFSFLPLIYTPECRIYISIIYAISLRIIMVKTVDIFFVLKRIFRLDGTSPSPMLFTTTTQSI